MTTLLTENPLETIVPDDSVKQMPAPRKSEKRGIQLSIPDKLHELCIKILAKISGRTYSDMIREIMKEYIEFTKDILIEEGYYDPETKMFSKNPDDIIADYEKKKDNTKYLRWMQDETKETGLKFPFARPSRLY